MSGMARPVRGYEDLYEVFSDGRVFSKEKTVIRKGGRKNNYPRKELALRTTEKGYQKTYLCKDGKCRGFFVHRIVAEAFVSNENGKPFVNHIDFNRENNCAENLEWVTTMENNVHARTAREERLGLTPKDDMRFLAFSTCLVKYSALQLGRMMGLPHEAYRSAKAGKTWIHLSKILSDNDKEFQHLHIKKQTNRKTAIQKEAENRIQSLEAENAELKNKLKDLAKIILSPKHNNGQVFECAEMIIREAKDDDLM